MTVLTPINENTADLNTNTERKKTDPTKMFEKEELKKLFKELLQEYKDKGEDKEDDKEDDEEDSDCDEDDDEEDSDCDEDDDEEDECEIGFDETEFKNIDKYVAVELTTALQNRLLTVRSLIQRFVVHEKNTFKLDDVMDLHKKEWELCLRLAKLKKLRNDLCDYQTIEVICPCCDSEGAISRSTGNC